MKKAWIEKANSNGIDIKNYSLMKTRKEGKPGTKGGGIQKKKKGSRERSPEGPY